MLFKNKIWRYYEAEFEVLVEGLFSRERCAPCAIEKKWEVILAEPSDIKGYADGYALKHSSFPGEYKFTGNTREAKEYNAILDKYRKRGLLERIFKKN